MKRAIVLILCLAPIGMANVTLTIGDDDGFGSGTPMVTGDGIWSFASGDGDGTDRLVAGAAENLSYTFAFTPFVSVSSVELFVQYADWPESGGHLKLDDVQTDFAFVPLVPWEQEAPWTVLNASIDLTAYKDQLLDGEVVFRFVGSQTDSYAIDYMTLSVEGWPVPLPGAAPLALLGVVALAHWRRRNRL